MKPWGGGGQWEDRKLWKTVIQGNHWKGGKPIKVINLFVYFKQFTFGMKQVLCICDININIL